MTLTADAVLEKTRQMERLLASNYGATGRGLHTLATSVQEDLEPGLEGRIRWIATVRNGLAHEEYYVFNGDEQNFLSVCDEVIAALESHQRVAAPAPAATPRAPESSTTSSSGRSYARVPRETAEPTSKPWYRSTLFLVLAFLFFTPLWAILILTDREQGCLVKSIAVGFLLALGVSLIFAYESIKPYFGSALRAIPTPGGAPAATAIPTAAITAGAQATRMLETPAPAASGRCAITWYEVAGDALAGKNRYMVWDTVVKKQIAGSEITATQFYALVVDKNPSLKADGYVFKEGKTYLLPRCNTTR